MQGLIQQFRDVFIRFSEQVAVQEHMRGAPYRYRELEDLSSKLAAQLKPLVPKHGMVCLYYNNEIEIALTYLACLQLEITAVPINTALHRNEVVDIVSKVKPALLVTHQALADKLALEEVRVFSFGAEQDALPLAALRGMARLGEGPFCGLEQDFLALIMHTSGSTGVPKAIPIPASRLLGHVLALQDTSLFGSPSRYYNVLPMSYIGGVQLLLEYLCNGSLFVLDEIFSPRSCYRFWETAMQYRVDTVWVTPTMAATLLAVGLEEQEQRGRIAACIRRVVVAMGPITNDVKARFEEIFGVRIQKSFGITETLLCCHWNDDMATPLDSVGKPLPGVEVHIIGEDEQPVAQGGEGEIRIGGAWVLDEYWRQPDITAATFDRAHRYRTGDLGRVDAKGHVFITGRIKDMLKCGGLNVSPAEVEAVILRGAGVREAAVFGVPDEFYGEKIVACVSALPGHVLREQELLALCRAELSALKVPSVIVISESLPQNAVGKVDKRAIKQAYLDGGRKGAA